MYYAIFVKRTPNKQQQVPEYLQTLRPQTAISQPMKSVITAEREHIYNLMNKPTN